MVEDEEGFFYPIVNHNECIDCGLCETVCPFQHETNDTEPIKVLAAYNNNEQIRLKSSSGGIFTMLAERTIHNGGIVFGARFNDGWDVILDYTEDISGIDAFRGSKYVQSLVGGAFDQCERFLKQHKEVLFSGTPCQIAGLKRFLGRDYDNLLTVDFVCHGVPSPMAWRKHVEDISNKFNFTSISFRDKVKGWNHFSLTFKNFEKTVYSETFQTDPYMQLFLNNYILRPSCHNCKVRSGKSSSDITLADFWHIEHEIPEMFDDKGSSLVLLNTSKGADMFRSCQDFSVRPASLDVVIRNNIAWKESYPMPKDRNRAFKMLKHMSVRNTNQRLLHPKRLLMYRVKNRLISKLKEVKHLFVR